MYIAKKINQLFNFFLNATFPPKCLACDCKTDKANLFCFKCWNSLTFISDPRCNICGTPFPIQMGKNAICPYCIEEKPKFDLARSIIRFDHSSEKLIHNFKYYDKTEAAKTLAQMMLKTYGKLINNIDIITAIPMYKTKLQKRKYNQAAILAQHIAKLSNKTYEPEILIKFKDSISQSGLTKEQRKENVKNTFKLNAKHKESIFRKNILLIDDVLTTGSTASECTKILKRNGIKRVHILTIARTY